VPQISHREQLLAGAISCLQTRGYARTTTRDIAAAADANLASIGYHFGSKEALLNAAIIENFEQWTRRIGELTFAEQDASPLERMATSLKVMLDSFAEHRPLLVAFVEAMAQSCHSDELREQLASHYRESRQAVAEMVSASFADAAGQLGAAPDVVASFLIAVCDGFVLQWLLDPARTPDGEELITGLGSALALALERESAAQPASPTP
jgi:AcrR family transcriptional regulator